MSGTLKQHLVLANEAMVLAFKTAPDFRRHLRCVAVGKVRDQYDCCENSTIARIEAEFREAVSSSERSQIPRFICKRAFEGKPSSDGGMALIALSVLWDVLTNCGRASIGLRDEITSVVRVSLGLEEHELGSEVAVSWLEAISGMRIVSEVETSL